MTFAENFHARFDAVMNPTIDKSRIAAFLDPNPNAAIFKNFAIPKRSRPIFPNCDAQIPTEDSATVKIPLTERLNFNSGALILRKFTIREGPVSTVANTDSTFPAIPEPRRLKNRIWLNIALNATLNVAPCAILNALNDCACSVPRRNLAI